ncbi:MAG: DUF4011 domain-containing protein [Reichenbachiella sp.]
MKKILQSYLRKLTNLSGNSRSILLLKLLSEQFIDLHAFNYALNEPSFKILEGLLGRKTKIPLCSIQDSRDSDSNKLSARLKKLNRIDHLVFEERGARDLYVGWPFVKGKFSDGTITRCPLMFFPVAIDSDKKNWNLVIRKDVNVTMNKSFLLAYAYYNNVKPNENLLDRVFDDFDKESTGFRTDLYELLKEENFEINFNQENFQNELQSFHKMSRSEIEDQEKEGELKLYPQGVLGIFPQAGSYLVPDYLAMLDQPHKSLEDFFLERNLDENEDDDSSYYRFLKKVKEDQTFTPFKMDSYQENVIKAIKRGNSAVVQGPPGTGKSQLICNLVSDYIARGKNVLVVSQKRAALDVVFQRLKEKQLGDFLGLLHDFKNDRKPIYEQIEGQISRLEGYIGMNNSLDTIQIERNFLKTSRRIDQLDEELDEFKAALFDEKESGLSVKELYLTSSPHEQFFPMNLEYRKFNFLEIDEFIQKLLSYANYAKSFANENHPWFKRKSFSKYSVGDLSALSQLLSEIEPFINVLETLTEKAIGKKMIFEDVAEVVKKEEEIEHLTSLLQDETVYNGLVKLLKPESVTISKNELTEHEQIVLKSYENNGPELSLESSELGRFQEVLERGIDARGNLLKWFWWKLFSKDKIFMTRVLVANNLKSNKEGFNNLIERVDSRLNLEHNLTKLKTTIGLSRLPESFKKINIQNWFFFQKQSIEARDILSGIRHMTEYISPSRMDQQEYIEKLKSLLVALEPIAEKLGHWEEYLSIPQLREIFAKQMEIDLLLTTLKKDFDSICEYDKLQEGFDEDEKRIVEKINETVPIPDAEKWHKVFLNSLKLAWIDHIEIKYPILRTVSSQKFEEMQIELQRCVSQKFQLSNEILLMKSRERVYKNTEYNRLNNMVTYRDLNHQVTKKRRIWPVRKLIGSFPREIFDLIPCWLASPESASAIFPMEKIFDLVIFDEASQCFAEKGLPAMYRGKQVVIAGDEKQLQPNDLYQVRWEDENENEVADLDFDSLLNLSAQYLMQVQLNGHYRSKNLELIRFSNQHFYKNRLRMLPDFNELNEGKNAIEYVHVDGIWEKNGNRMEVEKVAEIVKNLLSSKPDLEIGIVTFNAQQQMNIMDYLEEYSIANKFVIPDSLIVKNIENIQGDEKDVIIFSTVYAPDSSGKLNMNFGSLNVQGGENRLNVAVTRAKEKIFLVTSILPQQLRVEETKNEGPKLLKKYLEYAFEISNGDGKGYNTSSTKHSVNWYLSSKIREMEFENIDNLTIDNSMPFVDLTIRHHNKYIGAILTDDELYHDAISIKASHVYQHYVLKQKKWKFATFFSRQLWSHPEHLHEQIKRLIGRNINSQSN